MTLQAIAPSLEEIPEALRQEYAETADPRDPTKKVWALDLDNSIRTHPKVRALSSTLEKLKSDLKARSSDLLAATDKLARFPEDFDPDTYHALIEEQAGKGKKIDEQIAAVRAEEQRKRDEAIAPLQSRAQTLEAKMKRKAVHEALTEALIAASVAPEFMSAAAALIEARYKVSVAEENDEFAVTINSPTGDLDAKEFVRNWTQGDEGKPFVAKPRGGGANGGSPGNGAGAGGADNPWDATGGKRPNLTKQQMLITKQPELARRYAIAAGVRPTW